MEMPSLEVETLRLEPRLAANDAAASILIFHTYCIFVGVFFLNFFFSVINTQVWI